MKGLKGQNGLKGLKGQSIKRLLPAFASPFNSTTNLNGRLTKYR